MASSGGKISRHTIGGHVTLREVVTCERLARSQSWVVQRGPIKALTNDGSSSACSSMTYGTPCASIILFINVAQGSRTTTPWATTPKTTTPKDKYPPVHLPLRTIIPYRTTTLIGKTITPGYNYPHFSMMIV